MRSTGLVKTKAFSSRSWVWSGGECGIAPALPGATGAFSSPRGAHGRSEFDLARVVKQFGNGKVEAHGATEPAIPELIGPPAWFFIAHHGQAGYRPPIPVVDPVVVDKHPLGEREIALVLERKRGEVRFVRSTPWAVPAKRTPPLFRSTLPARP